MAGFYSALSASLVLFLLMAVGYGMGTLGWMTATEKRFISKYIINIAVPCNCISGLLNNLDHDSLAQAGIMLVSAVLGVAVTLALSLVLVRLLRLPRERQGVFVSMAAFSNVLFIGIPVCTQLFGEACMPYVMVYYLANTSFVQSAGLILIERSGTAAPRVSSPADFVRDLCNKPPILAVVFSLVLLAAISPTRCPLWR